MDYKVTEIFKSIQGEGGYIGTPSIFLRFYGCQLNCSFCDSTYSIQGREYIKMTYEDIIRKINKLSEGDDYNNNITNLVITGGEPLLQITDNFLSRILYNTRSIDTIEIETNGLLLKYLENQLYFSNNTTFNISPKFINNWKQKYSHIKEIVDKRERKYCFKFVLEHGKNRKKCINNILQFIKLNNINRSQIYIMSEGLSKSVLTEKRMQIDINFCMNHGFKYTPRLHILVWDKKRKV